MSAKEKPGIKVLVIILLLLIIVAGGILAYKVMNSKEEAKEKLEAKVEEQEQKQKGVMITEIEEKEVQIFNGKDRPIAVMIDNHQDAWPQAGIQKAYMVYEIIVEGGETRLMAVFKGQDIEEIGPVRSARHYFIDYVMENDAIYVHFGQSPQAQNDLKRYSIDAINGIQEDGITFWRTKAKAAPHNAMTSTEKILQSAKNKKYKTMSTKESVLKYTTDEVNLENAQDAASVTIPHSNLQTVKYVYDEENKVYERYARNKQQTDLNTKEGITVKNIIITFCENYTLTDSENKGRQGLKNIGTFDGYYITNGKAIRIKCEKEGRDEKTVYKDLDGNIIKVNDGNTFLNICAPGTNVEIGGEK